MKESNENPKLSLTFLWKELPSLPNSKRDHNPSENRPGLLPSSKRWSPRIQLPYKLPETWIQNRHYRSKEEWTLQNSIVSTHLFAFPTQALIAPRLEITLPRAESQRACYEGSFCIWNDACSSSLFFLSRHRSSFRLSLIFLAWIEDRFPLFIFFNINLVKMRLSQAAAQALSCTVTIAAQASSCSATTTPRATVAQGLVEGFLDSSDNSVFLGIPYAATTGGENRFVPPNHCQKPRN